MNAFEDATLALMTRQPRFAIVLGLAGIEAERLRELLRGDVTRDTARVTGALTEMGGKMRSIVEDMNFHILNSSSRQY